MEILIKHEVFAIVERIGPRRSYEHINGFLFLTKEKAENFLNSRYNEKERKRMSVRSYFVADDATLDETKEV